MMYLGAVLLMVWLGMFCPTDIYLGGLIAMAFGASWAWAWRA